MKSPRLKEEFEHRYTFAARYKENMARFLKQEIEILQDIITVEEDKKRQKERDQELINQRRERQKSGDFADKILQDFEKRISIYPEININPDTSIEVRKLFGALKVFEDRYWNSLSKYMRDALQSSRTVDQLENELWTLLGSINRNAPVLDRYLFLLERPEQDLKAISMAEQACLKKVAFFLNDILSIYIPCSLERVPPNSAVAGYDYVNQLIFNFRLADIKKSH